jgi:starch synthase (maltosyl-transferring)
MSLSETTARPRAASVAAESASAPRIYYLHPLDAGPLARWDAHLARAARLGFTHLLLAPLFAGADLFAPEDFDRPHAALAAGTDALAALAAIAAACSAHGLIPLLDVAPAQVAAGGEVARARPDLFRAPDPARALDPRSYSAAGDVAVARFDDAAEALAEWWAGRLVSWHQAGMRGFRVTRLGATPAPVLHRLIQRLRRETPATMLLGWTPGLGAQQLAALAGAGLDFVFCSLPWWNFRDDWFWAEQERLARIAPVVAPVEAPFGRRIAAGFAEPQMHRVAARRLLGFAAGLGAGWLLPMGFEWAARYPLDPRHAAAAANAAEPALAAAIAGANAARPRRWRSERLSAPGADAVVVLRTDAATRALDSALVANAALDRAVPLALAPLLRTLRAEGAPPRLAAGEVLTLRLQPTAPITLEQAPLARSAAAAAQSPRIAIESVSPRVDGGRFAAKRLAGETLRVSCDVICDGHGQLGVALLWRSADEAAWRETRMRPLGNDRFAAELVLARVGRWLFTIEAWYDVFATWRDEVSKKHAAGMEIRLELMEGAAMLRAAAARVPALRDLATSLAQAGEEEAAALLLAARTAAVMAEADARPFAVRLDPPCPVDADRARAVFGSWYELFPRSMSDDATRHGTFRDVIRHLPRIAAMGFDVLYFPPIHPIGRTARKGRNNTLGAGPGNPGSPYAIGTAAGGHDAIHPRLGTLEDFAALREAAAAEGIELALDFAVQCSRDHPWLAQHPGWFDWRPDGSLKFAENPPKKYEDIVNLDFYAEGAVPDLWVALCRVVQFWAEQGVRIFRVDNPHTKPFPFWEWLIAEVRATHPDAIFLAEAFTRPKIMARLAKLGFTQSYTYFTWRNTRAELAEYLTELTTGPMADYFRPNFFVNTPDINPFFLQASGRAGFLIRAALAATLAGSWGIYCGFELCEAAAIPGREEYADSEKYQLRAWDWDRPGNIVAEIAVLNRIRRANPALQSHLGLTLLSCDNDAILAYAKATADNSNLVIVAVSVDPQRPQAGTFELPLWRWGLHDAGSLLAEDLLRESAAVWQAGRQRAELSPEAPYAIWRLRRAS